MASKAALLLLACFLLLTSKVSLALEEGRHNEGFTLAVAGSPVVYPIVPPTPLPSPPLQTPPPPQVKAPIPPSPSPLVPPPPPSPVVKAPLPPPNPNPPPPSPVKPYPPTPVRPYPPPVSPPRNLQECIPLCRVRCKLHSRQNVCMRACLTCCGRCKCVPPGYYGNREKCGICYTRWTTRGGRPKCP